MRILACCLVAAATMAGSPAFAQAQATGAMAPDEGATIPPNPGMGAYGGQPAGVKKMSDAALDCQQIYAETETLQKSLAEQQAGAAAAQQAADDVRNGMMSQAMSGGGGMQRGASMASGLLGMIPGVGMVAGLVGGAGAQASMQARMADMQDSTNKMMQAQQKAIDIQQAMAWSQARHEHLVDLFLKKNCTLPQK
ncbi:hypothetical protein D9M73_50300 [compost metagenome]